MESISKYKPKKENIIKLKQYLNKELKVNKKDLLKTK